MYNLHKMTNSTHTRTQSQIVLKLGQLTGTRAKLTLPLGRTRPSHSGTINCLDTLTLRNNTTNTWFTSCWWRARVSFVLMMTQTIWGIFPCWWGTASALVPSAGSSSGLWRKRFEILSFAGEELRHLSRRQLVALNHAGLYLTTHSLQVVVL